MWQIKTILMQFRIRPPKTDLDPTPEKNADPNLDSDPALCEIFYKLFVSKTFA
jgi:hypothetical protein